MPNAHSRFISVLEKAVAVRVTALNAFARKGGIVNDTVCSGQKEVERELNPWRWKKVLI
jgi:hypothetical protein